MANKILPTGYETQVQVDMGVSASVLPVASIQSKATLAEAIIVQSVPNYATITGDTLTFLQSACIAQVCVLLCPGMSQRIKISQADETGYSFRLHDTDWDKKKAEFERIVKDMLYMANGEVYAMPSAVGVVSNDRLEI